MKTISDLGSKIPVFLIISALILSSGCDMGTYGRRMQDKAKPLQSDADQAIAIEGNSPEEDDSTDE